MKRQQAMSIRTIRQKKGQIDKKTNTGGRPTHKLQTTRGMNLQTDKKVEKPTNNNTREKNNIQWIR